mmetsp:Transcript_94375/g.272789  ORF Transcript_94375/g.272789 Transcript_94375/m.272789 type:complete len:206 (-) Transcript_94375:1073-1690(-)
MLVDPLDGHLRQEAGAWGDKHIRQVDKLQEPCVEASGLVRHPLLGPVPPEELVLPVVDIEAGPCDVPREEGVDEGVGVDQRAARHVDEQHSWLHGSDGVSVDHLPRLRAQAHVQRDHVAGGVELGQADELRAQGRELVGELLRAAAQDAHAESGKAAGRGKARDAGADDAASLAVKVDSHEAAEHVVVVLCAVAGALEAAIQADR